MQLSEEARKLRNARAREYYATHKQQYAEANRRYWENKAAKENQKTKSAKEKPKVELGASYWICRMVLSNWNKTYDKSLFPVSNFVSMCFFSGFSERYAKRIYNYILNNNYHELFPDEVYWCYVSGENSQEWVQDYFVLPFPEHTYDELYNRAWDIGESVIGRK